MQDAGAQLVRADSWTLPGSWDPQLLKTVSNAQEPPFLGVNCAPASQGLQGQNMHHPSAANTGKPPLVPTQHGAGSTNSTLTAGPGQKPQDGAASVQQLVLPMRQISLDTFTAVDLCKAPDGVPDRSSIFNDVIEQLAAKEESLPVQSGLYTLPSLQFLESLLEDMDSKSTSTGHQPEEPPLYLPLDTFDLHFEDSHSQPAGPAGPRHLVPSPFDLPPQTEQQQLLRQQSLLHPHHHLQQQQRPPIHRQCQPQQQHAYHLGAATGLQQPVAHPAPHGHGFIPTSSSMPLLGHASSGFHGSSQIPHSRSAGPSPTKPVRRAASAYGAFDYQLDEAEMNLQMSKSGRMRKVASYTGTKRKMSNEMSMPRGPSLPHELGYHHGHGGAPSHVTNTVSESDTGATTLDDDSDDEVSRGSKASRKQNGNMKKGGKRTTCLNCGCHQTPQWRCGPLGPRTLCNACGVRYKKGLALNCWPIREGMVLPPGAVLPPGVHIPGVILQPAEDE